MFSRRATKRRDKNEREMTMHKLNAITGAAIGVTLAIGAIGFVEGIVTGAEFIATIVAGAFGLVAAIVLTERGQ